MFWATIFLILFPPLLGPWLLIAQVLSPCSMAWFSFFVWFVFFQGAFSMDSGTFHSDRCHNSSFPSVVSRSIMLLFIYLFVWDLEREEIVPLTAPFSAPCWSQTLEQGTPCRYPTWGAGAPLPEPQVLPSKLCLSGKLETEARAKCSAPVLLHAFLLAS